MAGKGKADADVAEWLTRTFAALSAQVDQAVADLAACPPAAGETAEIDRRARAVANLARAARYVAALRERPCETARRKDDIGEGMSEDDREEYTPADLERLRAELQSRLDHLRDLFERKGLDRWPGAGATETGDPGRAEAA